MDPPSTIADIFVGLRESCRDNANQSCARFAALSVEASDAVFRSVEGRGSEGVEAVAREIAVLAQIFHRRNERLMMASVATCLGRTQRFGQGFLLKVIKALEREVSLRGTGDVGRKIELPQTGGIALYFLMLSRMPIEVSARIAVGYLQQLLKQFGPEATFQQALLITASAQAAFEGWAYTDFQSRLPLATRALKHLIASKRKASTVESHRIVFGGLEELFNAQGSDGDVCEEIVADLARNAASGYPERETSHGETKRWLISYRKWICVVNV